jgi:acyl-CoA reductase-like NAD-dependent aldehyde dehydrogenase
VVQLVQGDGAVGAALVGGNVQMIGMTGSTATGKKIMEAASTDLKRLVLELGGKVRHKKRGAMQYRV